MATHAAESSPKPAIISPHFVLRRLHSLSGVVPVGVFVCFHLFTNMQLSFKTLGITSADEFQHEVEWIHNAIPALWAAEIFGIWLPIAFHALLGIAYTFTGKGNVKNYGYWDNWRYTLQRVTGIIALVFIFFHVATLRWRWDIGGWYTPFFVDGLHASGGGFELVPLSTYSTAIALDHPLVLLLYIVGVLSVVFHWSNGLWTAAISWGVTLSDKAQKQWAYVCYLMFVGLFVFSALAITGALAYDPSEKEVAAYELSSTIYAEHGLLPHELFEHGHDGGELKPEHREIVELAQQELVQTTTPGTTTPATTGAAAAY